MYDPNRDDVINECDSDNDSIYEDEDETTRIVPPSGMEFFCITILSMFLCSFFNTYVLEFIIVVICL